MTTGGGGAPSGPSPSTYAKYKKFMGRWGMVVVGVEVGTLVGAYVVYDQLAKNEKYREVMTEKMPWLMEAFHTATQGKYR